MSQESPFQLDEGQVVPEKPRIRLVKTVALSGPSYSGKDMLARILNARHGWPVEDGKGRFERRTGVETGHMRRDPSKHRDFDRFQAETFRTLTPEESIIWQTRLAGIILAEERDRRAKEFQRRAWTGQTKPLPPLSPIPAISVLLWARKEMRVDRAFIDATRAWEEKMAKLSIGDTAPYKPTKAEVEALMEERQRRDVEVWSSIPQHKKYIHLVDENGKPFNPFSRTLKRESGAPVYDSVIDTSNLSLEEVADKFELEILRFNAVEPSQEALSSLAQGEPLTSFDSTPRLLNDNGSPATA